MPDMSALAKALMEIYQVEIDSKDTVVFEHNYCGYHIVDVTVTDWYTGKSYTFPCFDTNTGVFPY